MNTHVIRKIDGDELGLREDPHIVKLLKRNGFTYFYALVN